MPRPASGSSAEPETPPQQEAERSPEPQRPDPNDPGEGNEWVYTQDFHDEVNPAKGEIEFYKAGEPHTRDEMTEEWRNPSAVLLPDGTPKYGACGPLIKARKKRQNTDESDGQRAETKES